MRTQATSEASNLSRRRSANRASVTRAHQTYANEHTFQVLQDLNNVHHKRGTTSRRLPNKPVLRPESDEITERRLSTAIALESEKSPHHGRVGLPNRKTIQSSSANSRSTDPIPKKTAGSSRLKVLTLRATTSTFNQGVQWPSFCWSCVPACEGTSICCSPLESD